MEVVLGLGVDHPEDCVGVGGASVERMAPVLCRLCHDGYRLGMTSVILSRMKTAISIPDNLFMAAERTAKRLGMSRSELYRRALRGFLEDHDELVVREALDELYSADPDASRLDSELERLQVESLREEDW